MSKAETPRPGDVTRFTTSGGGKVYRIQVCAFPGLWGYVCGHCG